jgi:hypothetical protein
MEGLLAVGDNLVIRSVMPITRWCFVPVKSQTCLPAAFRRRGPSRGRTPATSCATTTVSSLSTFIMRVSRSGDRRCSRSFAMAAAYFPRRVSPPASGGRL